LVETGIPRFRISHLGPGDRWERRTHFRARPGHPKEAQIA
jgi:hypothetical protein